MSDRNRTLPGRVSAAYGTLRGRPPKPDYGILLILPFVAAAGGALVGLGVEVALDRRRTAVAARRT